MSEVMISDRSQPVCLEQLRKALCNIMGLNQITDLVDTYIKKSCDVYFADPYCAWQKGSNENSNGLLREFYSKGRNLYRVSPVTLKRNLALINARPRKVLNFVSAQYLWDLELHKVLHLV